jgi:hypothetical protein
MELIIYDPRVIDSVDPPFALTFALVALVFLIIGTLVTRCALSCRVWCVRTLGWLVGLSVLQVGVFCLTASLSATPFTWAPLAAIAISVVIGHVRDFGLVLIVLLMCCCPVRADTIMPDTTIPLHHGPMPAIIAAAVLGVLVCLNWTRVWARLRRWFPGVDRQALLVTTMEVLVFSMIAAILYMVWFAPTPPEYAEIGSDTISEYEHERNWMLLMFIGTLPFTWVTFLFIGPLAMTPLTAALMVSSSSLISLLAITALVIRSSRTLRRAAYDYISIYWWTFLVPRKQYVGSDVYALAIRNATWKKSKARKGHSHARAARDRSDATVAIPEILTSLGFQPYSLWASKREARQGIPGYRPLITVKDTVSPIKIDPVPANPAFMCIDSDFYCDKMPQLLADWPDAIFGFYTLTVTEVSNQPELAHGESSFTFLEDGTFREVVSGPAHYEHKLWDWQVDTFSCSDEVFSALPIGRQPNRLFGLPSSIVTLLFRRVSVRLVVRHTVNAHRSVVFCLPVSTLWVPRFLNAKPHGGVLKRFNPIVEFADGRKLAIIRNQPSQGVPTTSVGVPGAYACATVDSRQFEALLSNVSISKSAATAGMIRLFSEGCKHKVTHAESAILAEILASGRPERYQWTFPTPTRTPDKSTMGEHSYSVSYDFYSCVAGPDKMHSFMDPLVEGLAPAKTRCNEEVAVGERISRNQHRKVPPLPDDLKRYVDEFINALPEACSSPLSAAEINAANPRPSQQRNMEIANFASHSELDKEFVKVFLKSETYQDCKDPRLISPLSPHWRITACAIIHGLSRTVKSFDWYAFAKTPAEIADAVVRVCLNAAFVLTTDFSRMDSCYSAVIWLIVIRMLCHMSVPEYRDIIRVMMTEFLHSTAKAPLGTYYDTMLALLSGSDWTSLVNTLVNRLIVYCAARRCGETHEAAWKRAGLAGGDDGLNRDIDPAVLKDTAAAFGFILKCEVIHHGEPGVNFLARFFSQAVWYGDPGSSCDMMRQLAKLHLSTTPALNAFHALSKAFAKADALMRTDSLTPIIGLWADTVCRVAGCVGVKADVRDMPFFARMYDNTVQFPTTELSTGWDDVIVKSHCGMLEYWAEEICSMCEEYGKRQGDLVFRDQLISATLSPPRLFDNVITPPGKLYLHYRGLLFEPRLGPSDQPSAGSGLSELEAVRVRHAIRDAAAGQQHEVALDADDVEQQHGAEHPELHQDVSSPEPVHAPAVSPSGDQPASDGKGGAPEEGGKSRSTRTTTHTNNPRTGKPRDAKRRQRKRDQRKQRKRNAAPSSGPVPEPSGRTSG